MEKHYSPWDEPALNTSPEKVSQRNRLHHSAGGSTCNPTMPLDQRRGPGVVLNKKHPGTQTSCTFNDSSSGNQSLANLPTGRFMCIFVGFQWFICHGWVPGSPTTIFYSKVYHLPKGTTIFKMVVDFQGHGHAMSLDSHDLLGGSYWKKLGTFRGESFWGAAAPVVKLAWRWVLLWWVFQCDKPWRKEVWPFGRGNLTLVDLLSMVINHLLHGMILQNDAHGYVWSSTHVVRKGIIITWEWSQNIYISCEILWVLMIIIVVMIVTMARIVSFKVIVVRMTIMV